MRFLLINNHCINEPSTGDTRSLRTIVRWLSEAGHACHILTTSRFHDLTSPLEDRLRDLGVLEAAGVTELDGRRVLEYSVDGIPVTLLLTRHNDEARPDSTESRQYGELVRELLARFRPDQMIACNGHPMVLLAMRDARARGVTTVFTLRASGYYDRRYFRDVDHVFTNSRYLTKAYEREIALISTPIPSPIAWSDVLAPHESRAFVTYVNPVPHKGLMLFARLADMLGSRRPDIPLLIVQSVASAGSLNAIRGLDFSSYPQIMASPPVQRPADYFALTRIAIVPSIFEGFGRVAAEAAINGVPPVVSDRGGLPEAVGGDFSAGGAGWILPIPGWMTHDMFRLPAEEETQPWFDAVTSLWDDSNLYERAAARASQFAQAHLSEQVSRARHLDYLTALKPGGRAFS